MRFIRRAGKNSRNANNINKNMKNLPFSEFFVLILQLGSDIGALPCE